MAEDNQNVERLYSLMVRFWFLGLIFGIIVVIFITLKMLTRLENLAPAEMRLLLDLLKNRFFQ
ncbi:MAG TPA: hypothetical protein VLR94_07115 [Acidobacteriota bacterium]|nr:hypothetical protein [Acidobacteriota bacterium]